MIWENTFKIYIYLQLPVTLELNLDTDLKKNIYNYGFIINSEHLLNNDNRPIRKQFKNILSLD